MTRALSQIIMAFSLYSRVGSAITTLSIPRIISQHEYYPPISSLSCPLAAEGSANSACAGHGLAEHTLPRCRKYPGNFFPNNQRTLFCPFCGLHVTPSYEDVVWGASRTTSLTEVEKCEGCGARIRFFTWVCVSLTEICDDQRLTSVSQVSSFPP